MVVDSDEHAVLEWQRQSTERSLRSARARAHARSHRFVAAATQVLREEGTTDFTVQDIVDRSRMSIRTFYKYFASKDDLLVAVYETVVAREVVPRLREQIDKFSDPMRRLRAYVDTLCELTEEAQPVHRTLTIYQNRLAESRPADLARAMKPQFDLLVGLIRDVARTRPLGGDLTVEIAARLMDYTVQSAIHGRVLGSGRPFDIPAKALSRFCFSGMGFVD
jgi:AcrR family transcriptional regulator